MWQERQNWVLFERSICVEKPMPMDRSGNAKRAKKATILPTGDTVTCGRETTTAISKILNAMSRRTKSVANSIRALPRNQDQAMFSGD
jgi:hypothetical protein